MRARASPWLTSHRPGQASRPVMLWLGTLARAEASSPRKARKTAAAATHERCSKRGHLHSAPDCTLHVPPHDLHRPYQKMIRRMWVAGCRRPPAHRAASGFCLKRRLRLRQALEDEPLFSNVSQARPLSKLVLVGFVGQHQLTVEGADRKSRWN